MKVLVGLGFVAALSGTLACGGDDAVQDSGSTGEGSSTTSTTSPVTLTTSLSATEGSSSEGTGSSTDETATVGSSSESSTGATESTTGSTTNVDTDSDTDTDTDSDTDVEPGTLPRLVPQSGVVYVAHFLSNDLRIYRVDGASPRAQGTFNLGTFTHDMALDDFNDRMITAHDIAREVRIYDLERPVNAETDVAMPSLRTTIDIMTPPRFVKVDPYHDRLFVVADDTKGGTGLIRLHIFDIADPDNPTELGDSVATIPATTSIELDVARGILFAFHGIPDTLGAYDVVTGDAPVELPGSPIDMTALYPQENQNAFQVRNLTADIHNNRLYGARAQSALSEIIVIEYPPEIPGDGQSYGDVATLEDIVPIDDGFDVDVPIADRPGILDAFTPLPSPTDDMVLMLASAWNGTQATATVVGMQGDPLALAEGCQDHEGFGCFLRFHSGGTPGSHLRTDGAACRDLTHSVVVATALGSSEDEPGSVTVFDYDVSDGTTAHRLTADGGILNAAELPIGALCH